MSCPSWKQRLNLLISAIIFDGNKFCISWQTSSGLLLLPVFSPSFKKFKQKNLLILIEVKGWPYWKYLPYMKDSIGTIIIVTILLHWLADWWRCGWCTLWLIPCEQQSFTSSYQMMKLPLKCCVILIAYGYFVAGNLCWRFQCNPFHYKTQSCEVNNEHVLFSFFELW